MRQNTDVVDVVDGVVVDVTDSTPLAGGVLEIIEGGIGFLRGPSLLPDPSDIYVAQSQIHKFDLRTGDMVVGQVRPPEQRRGEIYTSLLHIKEVNNGPPEAARRRPHFHQMTATHPHELYDLTGCGVAPSLITLEAPLGRGQRGLLVGSPKTGKTVVMMEVANGLTDRYPDVYVMGVLIGERPEEITDMKGKTRADIFSADFDAPDTEKAKVAEMAFERAKRLAESGKDVVILFDGITRTTRALHSVVTPSGRLLSGGTDPAALEAAKRLFATARALAEGGSVAILATCLIETGSRMDDVIFEEFKGTGNMELHLDRDWAKKEVFPAIGFDATGTRRDELLLTPETRTWREIIFTLFRLKGWGSDWTKRETLFEIVDREPTWPKVGIALLQHVLKQHPGAAETFLGRLSPAAMRVLFSELQSHMTEEQQWTFEALARVPKLLEKEEGQKKAET